jgi:hypothetical protein
MRDKPKPDHTASLREDIPEEVMGKLRAAYQASGSSLKLGCPAPETVIAYALEELSPERRPQVYAHLAECKDCLGLVLDLRSAWDETQGSKQEVQERISIRVRAVSLLSELAERVRGWFSHLLPLPRLIPAAVALGILAVVSLGVYQHLTAPISIQLDLISLGRNGLLTRGPSEERKNLVPKGGVLRSGDRFEIVFATNKDAYVYVFFQDNTGKITRLFSGKILKNEQHTLIGGDSRFKLDETRGQEEVHVMAAKRPLVNLDEVEQRLTQGGIDSLRQSYPQSSFQSFTFKHE